jgi:quinol monooxygenase YgiN
VRHFSVASSGLERKGASAPKYSAALRGGHVFAMEPSVVVLIRGQPFINPVTFPAQGHLDLQTTMRFGKEIVMTSKLAILARLEAKPGKEQALADFLASALPLAQAEAGTVTWFALKLGAHTFGIFDTFADDHGRQAHLNGEIAKALFAKADELLAQPPAIEMVDILAAKESK